MAGIMVLLLRGVNVSGANRLPMAEFRQMLTGLGLIGVQTHVQSGNAVFRDPGLADLPTRISLAMKDRFGFAPGMILMPLAALEAVLAANPFHDEGVADGKKVHIWFLAEPAPADAVAALATHAADGEVLRQTDAAIYFLAPNGIGRSVLAEKLERGLKGMKTARNYNSVLAIAALARTIAA